MVQEARARVVSYFYFFPRAARARAENLANQQCHFKSSRWCIAPSGTDSCRGTVLMEPPMSNGAMHHREPIYRNRWYGSFPARGFMYHSSASDFHRVRAQYQSAARLEQPVLVSSVSREMPNGGRFQGQTCSVSSPRGDHFWQSYEENQVQKIFCRDLPYDFEKSEIDICTRIFDFAERTVGFRQLQDIS